MAGPTIPMDGRQRPVVFETRAQRGVHRQGRRPRRILMWITVALLGAATCCGLAEGGSAVWSVLVPKARSGPPAPLWVNPPTIALHRQDDPVPVQKGDATVLDHSGDSGGSGVLPPLAPGGSATHVEPGDPDAGGVNSGGVNSGGRGSDDGGGGSRHGRGSGDG